MRMEKMIKVIYENSPDQEFNTLQEAEEVIMEKVLNNGDCVYEIRDLETGLEYGCFWKLKIEEL